MLSTTWKLILLRLNPFMVSFCLHSVALAAVIYTQGPGLPMTSQGDMSIELVGVDGGQGGEGRSQASSREPAKPTQAKVHRVAKKKSLPQLLNQKRDEFSLKPPHQDTDDSHGEAQTDKIHQEKKTQRSQALNVGGSESSSLAGRPGTQGGGSVERTFIQNLYTQLERNKHYPMRARKLRIEGQVEVSFRVLRNGQIEDIEVVSASPSEALNQAALETVRKASGRWPLPESLKSDALPLQITFNFSLNGRT